MKEQQLIECQKKMEELSRKHEDALNEVHTLKEQVEHLEKSVAIWYHNPSLLLFYPVEAHSLQIK